MPNGTRKGEDAGYLPSIHDHEKLEYQKAKLLGANGTSVRIAFLASADRLIEETIRLDLAFRTVGSGGPGMERAQAFRALLRRYRALFSDPNVAPKRQEVFQTLEFLEISTDSLYTAFKDFVGITFNIKLMRAFSNLRNTLKECCSSPWPVSYNTLHTHLAVTFASLRDNLEIFNEKDVNTIRSAQNDETNVYTDITVISTFLSGVTASALQIVGPAMSGDSTLAVAVNTALFSSLVFSTASAAQSLLVITWFQSFVRLPGPEQSLPDFLFVWLRRGPIISLLVAGVLFVVGLVVFLYSSQQHPVTSITTTIFALLQTLGIICMIILLMRDRFRFRREAGITGGEPTPSSLLIATIEDMENIYMSAAPSGFPAMSPSSFAHGAQGLQAPSADEQVWMMADNDINDARENMFVGSPPRFVEPQVRIESTDGLYQMDNWVPQVAVDNQHHDVLGQRDREPVVQVSSQETPRFEREIPEQTHRPRTRIQVSSQETPHFEREIRFEREIPERTHRPTRIHWQVSESA